MEGAIFLFVLISAAVALISGYAEDCTEATEKTEATESRLQVIGNRCKG